MQDPLRAIGVVARALDSIANIEFQAADLTRGQYLYLMRIVETPGIIQAALGEMLKVDRTTVARSVMKLCRQGLVIRRTDPDNAKRQLLYATEAGKAAYDLIDRENAYSLKRALAGMSEEEVATLTRLLDRMSQNIDADWHLVKNGGQRHY